MKTLAIDLGKIYGWCFMDEKGYESGYETCSDLVEWGAQFTALLDKWKPDIVVLSQTNSYLHWNPARAMLLKAGTAFYICGKRGIQGIEFNDTSARKSVFGKAIKKKEVQERSKDLGMQNDELDAYVLAKGWIIQQNSY